MNNLTDQQKELLDEHLHLLLKTNKEFNLTRIDDVDSAKILHVEDSLQALDEIDQCPEGPLCDIGSGTGYPGIPIAICTNRQVVLVESVRKKAHALESMVRKMSLDNVMVFCGRAEELALKRNDFAVVTARALSTLPSLLELASPLLKSSGRLVAYKSVAEEEEIEQASPMCDKVGMAFVGKRTTTLSDGRTQRLIVVYEKDHDSLVNLPRRPGMAQKRPYKH